MSACKRFEREAVLALEQGRELNEHFATCPECLQARHDFDRLRQSLARSGEGLAPPPAWQQGVWRRVELHRRGEAGRAAGRVLRWYQRPSVVLPMAASLALIAILAARSLGPDGLAALDVRLEAQSTSLRGAEAHPGDRLVLEAATGGARFAELRVYRDERDLVLRCSDQPPCVRRDGRLEARFVLESRGRYQPILLVAERSPPEPSSLGLDADSGAALRAGAQVRLGDAIDVR